MVSGGFMPNSKLEIELPNELLIYKENIEATIKPFIEIKAKAEDNLRFWQSKFGGLPYFPKSLQYPTDSKGQAMFLLAQINFGETPKLESFPEKGILQFYISGGSDVYGACFESPAKQDDFKVLYFHEVAEDDGHLVTEFGFLPKPDLLPNIKYTMIIKRFMKDTRNFLVPKVINWVAIRISRKVTQENLTHIKEKNTFYFFKWTLTIRPVSCGAIVASQISLFPRKI